jgi:adenine-specific DNA-methyltransferase
MAKKAKSAAKSNQTAPYKYPEAKSLMRPEVGTQAQFKKKKPPKAYRYDSSLSPALDSVVTRMGNMRGLRSPRRRPA